MKRLSIIPLAVLAFAPLTRVTAQEPPPVKVGDRVRVTVPDMGVRNRDGTLQLLDADSLVMRPNGGPSRLVIPLASLTRFEVHRGEKSQTGKGAGIGFAIGAVGGIVFGVAASEGLKGSRTGICDEGCIPAAVAVGVVGFGGVGALLGALVGSSFKTDRWEEISLDQIRVSFVPQRDGRFAFGLSVRF